MATTSSISKNALPLEAVNGRLIAFAWLGMLLLSRLPQILLSETGVIDPAGWQTWWWIVIGAVLITLTYLWAAVRPLRGFFLMLTLIYVISALLSWLGQTQIWNSWFGEGAPWTLTLLGDRLGVIFLGLCLAAVLALRGEKRRDYFLVFGKPNAPAFSWRGGEKSLPWTIAGPLFAVVLSVLIGAGVLAFNPVAGITISQMLPLLPGVFILALMNAFGEELAYRAAPLSQLWQVVGSRQAIWLTAAWFGLGHYYGGVPSGVIGAVFLSLVALLIGKAMLDTKGIAIPVFIHIWGDVIVYLVIALATI
jgi:membrane protease YdiL (CAAX protease family)